MGQNFLTERHFCSLLWILFCFSKETLEDNETLMTDWNINCSNMVFYWNKSGFNMTLIHEWHNGTKIVPIWYSNSILERVWFQYVTLLEQYWFQYGTLLAQIWCQFLYVWQRLHKYGFSSMWVLEWVSLLLIQINYFS